MLLLMVEATCGRGGGVRGRIVKVESGNRGPSDAVRDDRALDFIHDTIVSRPDALRAWRCEKDRGEANASSIEGSKILHGGIDLTARTWRQTVARRDIIVCNVSSMNG